MAKSSPDLVPKMERINLLLDIYGELLTDKQARFVKMHYGDDLSFGEIASQHGVSRQAIYDAVKHALSNLEKYESVLGLLEKLGGKGAPDSQGRVVPALERLKRLRGKVKKQSIVYNVDWIVHDLAEAIELLESSRPQNEPGGAPES